MTENEKIDNALCELNKEILDLKGSKEYQYGLKVSKMLYSLKHLEIKRFMIAIQHFLIIKKLKKRHKLNENYLTYDDTIKTKTKIAVYTCITGNYDAPLEPVYVPDNIDFFIVTDMDISKNSHWKKIDIDTVEAVKGIDNTRKARYVKTHPHVFFQDYEYSIWIDSNFRVIGDLSKFIKYTGNLIPFASNWHPARNSIYTELEACILRKKDDPVLLKKQIEHYRSEGMPDDFGLIETNMIVRRHGDEKCQSLMEAWWKELIKWSKRDQLSLPYVIWKNGYTMKDFGFISTEIRRNPSVQVILHKSKYCCPVK